MKFILIICLFYPILALAEIDERKIDIYFANGIDTSPEDARFSVREILAPAIKKEFYQNEEEMERYIGKVALSYNQTVDFGADIWESIVQKIDILNLVDLMFDTLHKTDVNKQVQTYKKSIQSGHRILVIAHSQGNLFTGDAYNALDSWMKPYFEAVSVASPRHFKIKSDTPHIAFTNDIVPYAGGIFISIDNPNSEAGSIETHAFSYYMGHPSKESHLSTNVAKVKIMKAISKRYKVLNQVVSQWKVKQTQGCGCEKKILLTHVYSPDNMDYLIKDINPLNFDENGKLYQVLDESNDTVHWIKGSSDGTAIKNEQKHLPNTCYSLSGTEEIIKGSRNPNPHDGVLRVVLDWNKKDIDLTLSIDGPTSGVKETHPNYECPRENWYIATDNELQEGHYIVSVNAPSNVDISLMPEQIRLDVKALGKGEYLTLDINDTLLLNLGQVYDIEITKNAATGTTIATMSQGTTHSTVSYRETIEGSIYTADIFLLLKQVAMGPIAGASLLLEEYIVGNWEALYTGMTTSGSSINSNGLIIFPPSLQTNLSEQNILLLTASGGYDVDADDDLNMDETPTPVLGQLHAFIESEQVKNKNLKVNILTEITYQAVHNNVDLNTSKADLLSMLNDVSQLLLKKDLSDDDSISYQDTSSWLASFDKTALKFDYDLKIEPLVQKIYRGEDIYLDVYRLLYAGHINEFMVSDDEDTQSISVNLNSYADLSSLNKNDFVLKDKDGENVDFNFSIINEKILITPLSDLIEGQDYLLKFDLAIYDNNNNVYNDSYVQQFTITDTTPPIIPDSTIHIQENTTFVDIHVLEPSTPLNYTILGGVDEEAFMPSLTSHLFFKEETDYEHPIDNNHDNVYEVKISVSDRFSNATTKNIRVIVDDVKEGPVLEETYLSVDENMPIGTYVGNMMIKNKEDTNITNFTFSSRTFRVDNDGRIYTSKTFDYERLNTYKLLIGAKDSEGILARNRYAYININDIDEPQPEVHNFTGSMENNASSGKVVGQLYIYPGTGIDPNDVQVKLTGDGAEDFDINASGHITVSSTAHLNTRIQQTYYLKAIASNNHGESQEANVTIDINIWSKQIGTPTRDFSTATAVDKNNNFYVSGALENIYRYNPKVFISKYNNIGELQWTHEIPQAKSVKITSLLIDRNETLFVTGAKENGRIYPPNDNKAYSPWIMALSLDGEVLWETVLDNGSTGYDYFTTAYIDTAGDIIVSGKTVGTFPGYENTLNNNVFFTKLTPSGNIEWTKQFNVPITTSHVNTNGEFHILNSTNIIKFDTNLDNIVWNRRLGISHVWSDDYMDFTLDENNNLYVLCHERLYKRSSESGNGSYWFEHNSLVAKFQPNGLMEWKRSYGSEKQETPQMITINKNNEILLAGETKGNIYGNINKTPYISSTPDYYRKDIFITKIDVQGNMLATKQFGSINSDYIHSIIFDSNNNIYVTSEVNEAVDGNHYYGQSDLLITKFSY